MSVSTPTTGQSADGRARLGTPDIGRQRTARRAAILATLALLAWSIVDLISLALRHTTGPQGYGLLVAALAVGAAVLNVLLLMTARKRTWAVAGAVLLWAVVALGGVAGAVAHVAWPATGPYGDPRPKPALAPLAFTAMGVVGGVAIVVAQRSGSNRRRAFGEE
jgi:4-amino-4-deoxy-L-arabinose transferase-like glycosyltransferase